MGPKNATADHWHVLANRLFLDYVRGRLSATPLSWGDFEVRRHDTPQAHSTRIAVAYKNQFADLLAELEELPSSADIRDRWARAMQLAERDIAAYLAGEPQPGQLALT